MIALIAAAIAAPTPCDAREEADKAAVSAELLAMVERMRKGSMVRRDDIKRVIELDRDYQLCTVDDAFYAGAVFVTTFDPTRLKRAYALAIRAQEGRVPGAKLLVAQSYDRLLVSQDQGQVFLTQSDVTKKGEPCLYAVGAVADDAQRKAYGLGPAKPIFAKILEANAREGDPTPAALEKWGLYCKPVGSQAQKEKRR